MKGGRKLYINITFQGDDDGDLDAAQCRRIGHDGKIVAIPRKRPKDTLEELLAQCDLDAPWSEEEREWMDAPPVGKEIL